MLHLNKINSIKQIALFASLLLMAGTGVLRAGDGLTCRPGYRKIGKLTRVIEGRGRTAQAASARIQRKGESYEKWREKCESESNGPYDFQAGPVDVSYVPQDDYYRASRPVICCNRDDRPRSTRHRK